jgi:5-methylcytosine-specific restriction protein B
MQAFDRGHGPNPELESAGWRLLEPSLRGDPSPILGRPTWTRENARLLADLVGGKNADLGDRSFFDKLTDQLHRQTDDLIVFAAELLFIHALPLSDFKPQTKIDRVERVLRWAPSKPSLPSWMREALELRGVFRGGVGFKVQVWQQMLWMCRFVETWRDAEQEERELAFESPWAFGELLARTPKDSPALRSSINYLAWPGYFEAVVNADDRKRIRNAFAHEIGGATGDDEFSVHGDLRAIRERVDSAAGERVHWYFEPYKSQWAAESKSAGRRAWLVRSKQGGAALTQSWLDDGFVSLPATNLAIDLDEASPGSIREAIESGYAHLTYAQRLTMYREYSDFILKMRVDDVVVGLMDEHLVVGTVTNPPELLDDQSARLRRGVAWAPARPGVSEVPEPLPSLLDGQGVVVDITNALTVLDQYLGVDDENEEEDDEPIAPPTPLAAVPQLPDATDELAASVHMGREALQEMIDLLQARQQMVFYGPPGTGKTYVAQAIARHVVGSDKSRVRLVQFHPSYAYEDFFEGLRPAATSGGITFELRPGPLRDIADEARLPENADAPYVLIIDEMNRANLAKVFGELYYLLEYRNEGVRLQYSSNEPDFRLPKNLFIIGTMNTVDRSISLVDAAIRRRFPFVELHPSDEPARSVLRSYLTANHQSDRRARLLDELNARIEERDLQIGPSYLMRPTAEDAEGLARIWKYDILPLLEDHYYGRIEPAELRRRFGLAEIEAAIDGTVGSADYIATELPVAYEGAPRPVNFQGVLPDPPEEPDEAQ